MRQMFRAFPKYGLLVEYDMSGKMLKSCNYSFERVLRLLRPVSFVTGHESFETDHW